MKLKGGKLIYDGNTCIYNPNLIGKKYNKRDKHLISKLLPIDSMDNDLENIEDLKLKKLDTKHEYFILPLLSDEIRQIDKIEDNYLKDCKKVDKNTNLQEINKNFINIIQEFAGESYENLILKNKDNINVLLFFKGLLNIFKGILLLNKHNIIHRDIKLANIVLNDKNQSRIIDFGLITNDFDIENHNFTDNLYRYWSPDYVIFVNKTTKFINDNSYISNIIYKNYQSILPLKLINYVTKTTIDFFDIIYDSDQTLETLFKASLLQLDVFSLGILIFEIIYKLQNLINSKYPVEFIQDLLNLIIKMINGNPLERITIYDALIEYLLILKKYSILKESEFNIEKSNIIK